MKPATTVLSPAQKFARGLLWIDDLVLKITLAICGVLLSAMVVVQGLGVIFRFVLHNSLSWSDELAAYLFVWLTCLGAAAGVKLRVHPEVKALADRLPGSTQPALADFTDGAVLALGAIFLVYGGDMLLMMGTETATSLPISMTYPYLSIPVGGALLILHSVVRIVVRHLAPDIESATVMVHGVAEHI
jgi:TRAP-type C4-dicarboxylate transport system permease small subunit